MLSHYLALSYSTDAANLLIGSLFVYDKCALPKPFLQWLNDVKIHCSCDTDDAVRSKNITSQFRAYRVVQAIALPWRTILYVRQSASQQIQ